MPRLELGADGMVRFDGRIIAEIAYFDPEFADIIAAANKAFQGAARYWDPMANMGLTRDPELINLFSEVLEKAGWWKS